MTDLEKRVQTICEDLEDAYNGCNGEQCFKCKFLRPDKNTCALQVAEGLLNVVPKRMFTDNLCQLITMYEALDKNIDHVVVVGSQAYPGDIDYSNDKEELHIFLDDNTLPNIFLNTNKSFTIPDNKLIFKREEIEQELKLYEEEVHHDGRTSDIR